MPETDVDWEALRVRQWRYEQVRQPRGPRRERVEKTLARMLADSDVELEKIRRILDSGCPGELAVKVLL